MKILKLDKRNKGCGHFKYYLVPRHLKRPDFHEVREWAWQTWGASKELEEWLYDYSRMNGYKPHEVFCHNERWCWDNVNYNRRLYLKSDEELMMFKLRWE